jgi:hypothetical protein
VSGSPLNEFPCLVAFVVKDWPPPAFAPTPRRCASPLERFLTWYEGIICSDKSCQETTEGVVVGIEDAGDVLENEVAKRSG